MADVKVPRREKKLKLKNPITEGDEQAKVAEELYRLDVLERDVQHGLVKVRYIGYGPEYDEWRLMNEIVELTSDKSSSDEGPHADDSTRDFFQYPAILDRVCVQGIVKSLLISSRKGNPNCRTSMPFDQVSLDSLVVRSSMVPSCEQRKKKIYTLLNLSKFDDILGERWYIRGLNMAGDFCYVMHNTVRFYLKCNGGKIDYQLLNDGSIIKQYFGKGYHLVFSFVREDGVCAQWNDILKKSST